MPRDPAKLPVEELVAELREKHGVETVELVVPEPEGFGEDDFEMPDGMSLRQVPDPDFEEDVPSEEVPLVDQFVEAVPLEEAAERVSRAELAGYFDGLLDTTTERERERAVREAVERENEHAEVAAEELEKERRRIEEERAVDAEEAQARQRFWALMAERPADDELRWDRVLSDDEVVLLLRFAAPEEVEAFRQYEPPELDEEPDPEE